MHVLSALLSRVTENHVKGDTELERKHSTGMPALPPRLARTWCPCACGRKSKKQRLSHHAALPQGPLERLQTALGFLRLDEDVPSPMAGSETNEEQAR